MITVWNKCIKTDFISDNVYKLIQIWQKLSLYFILLLSIYLTFFTEKSHSISCLSSDMLKIEQVHIASFIAKVQRYRNKKFGCCSCHFKENWLLNLKCARSNYSSTSTVLNVCINRSSFRNVVDNWVNLRFRKMFSFKPQLAPSNLFTITGIKWK